MLGQRTASFLAALQGWRRVSSWLTHLPHELHSSPAVPEGLGVPFADGSPPRVTVSRLLTYSSLRAKHSPLNYEPTTAFVPWLTSAT